MQGRDAARFTIAALVTAGGFTVAGCGGDTTTSTTTGAKATSARAASVEEIVDQHPSAVAIVCRTTEHAGHEHTHHHEHSGHEHSHHEDSPQIAELDDKALDYVGPLAVESGVAPSDLLDEFVSRCDPSTD
jgi:hypothetical protein